MPSPRLTEINFYPVKSMARISPSRWEITRRGFRFDRRWMVVDKTGTFLTQRELPRLVLIQVEISPASAESSGTMRFSAPGMSDLELPLELERTSGETVTVRVWKDSVEAWKGPAHANEWLTQFLGSPSEFVFMPDSSERQVNRDYAHGQEVVSFVDGFPFLLISEESLQSLNQRLETPVPMTRFRPNLVVAGGEPFAEDNWKRIRIGNIVFDLVKPCPRCVVTTVDAKTGATAKEPLATLAKFRSVPGKGVLFGQNLIHRNEGALSVGETVSVLERY